MFESYLLSTLLLCCLLVIYFEVRILNKVDMNNIFNQLRQESISKFNQSDSKLGSAREDIFSFLRAELDLGVGYAMSWGSEGHEITLKDTTYDDHHVVVKYYTDTRNHSFGFLEVLSGTEDEFATIKWECDRELVDDIINSIYEHIDPEDYIITKILSKDNPANLLFTNLETHDGFTIEAVKTYSATS